MRVFGCGLAALTVIALTGCAADGAPASATPPVVVANDNRTPAGTLRDGVLTLDLDVVTARWYPESPTGPHVDVATFAERGKAPTIPAPLIRVTAGTRVRVVIRNQLTDSMPLGLWGPGLTTLNDSSTIALASGASRTVEFTAEKSGSYMYGARRGPYSPISNGSEQLAGAIVVDEPGTPIDDRIIVVNEWYVENADKSVRNVYAFNGRSWPATEHFDVTEGDTLHWRVLNPTTEVHPIHLHGAYFRVNARGDGVGDTVYAADQRRMVVTEVMNARSTMQLTWSPATPGNWLFHCHNSYHVSAGARLDMPNDGGHDAHSTDPQKHMAGLVLGIAVKPRAAIATRAVARQLSAVIAQGVAKDTAHVAPMTLSLATSSRRGATVPRGPRSDLIVLTRGEPTDITVHNTLGESTSIHWHGLELESWSDGVAGVSGVGKQVAPPIAPRDSFVARLTLKRAGTFIYHTHLNDHAQLSAGLYGPLVVLEPGQQWDPTRDLVFTAGLDNTALKGPAVNGGSAEPEFTVRMGQRLRLRFVNIQPEWPATFEVVRETAATTWRPVAKDGFELPSSQSVEGPARRELHPGETFDATWAPTVPAVYEVRMIAATGEVAYRRVVRVRR